MRCAVLLHYIIVVHFGIHHSSYCEACCEKKTRPGALQVASAPAGCGGAQLEAVVESEDSVETASFQRPAVFSEDCQSSQDGILKQIQAETTLMEMRSMCPGQQWQQTSLPMVWNEMAAMLRRQFCPAKWTTRPSSMGFPMGCRQRMDSVAGVTSTKQKSDSQGRQTQKAKAQEEWRLWTASSGSRRLAATNQPFCKSSACTSTSPKHGLAPEIAFGCIAQEQGLLACGSPTSTSGSQFKGGTSYGEEPARGGEWLRESSQEPRIGHHGPEPIAHIMEDLPQPVCDQVARICQLLHRAGKEDGRESCKCTATDAHGQAQSGLDEDSVGERSGRGDCNLHRLSRRGGYERCQGGHQEQQRSQDQGRLRVHDIDADGIESSSRCYRNRRRSTNAQACSHWCNGIFITLAQSYAAFCGARWSVTEVCGQLGQCPDTIKWNHSITQMVDYVDEWQAQLIALDLAVELGNSFAERPALSTPARKDHRHFEVTFDKTVEIKFYTEGCHEAQGCCRVPEQCFYSWHDKPWSLYPTSNFDKQAIPQSLTDLGDDSQEGPALPHERPRPAPQRDGSWQGELWHVWNLHATTYDVHEGPVCWIRTWYIHHETRQRCERPRELLVNRNFWDWGHLLITLWRDLFHVHESYAIHVVLPALRETDDWRHIQLDLILHQPDQQHRAAVLCSTFMEFDHYSRVRVHALSMPTPVWRWDVFRMAGVLFPQWTGSGSIRTGTQNVEGDRLMLHHGQSLTIFPWQPSDATSLMQRGMRRMPKPTNWDRGPTPAEILANARADLQQPDLPAGEDLQDQGEGEQNDQGEGDVPDYDDDDPGGESPDDNDPEVDYGELDDSSQATLLYGLGRRTQHAYIPWTTYEGIVQAVAQELAIHVNSITTTHSVDHQPIGLPVTTRVLIVHQVHDIPPTDTSQLILVDVIGYNRGLHTSGERRVWSLPCQMTRSQLLNVMDLDGYCITVRNRCLVQHNHEPWKQQDNRLRNLAHGDYIAIHLPPQDDGTSAWTFLKQMRGECSIDEDDDDSIQLMQNSLSARFTLPYDERLPIWHLPDWSLDQLLHTEDDHDNHELPRRPIEDMDPAVQDLFTFWENDAAVEMVEEGPVAYYQVWYISQERMMCCRQSRTVRLTADFTEWDEIIQHSWTDTLDFDSVRFWLVVRPKPPQSSTDGHAGHILLCQHRPLQGIPVLMTVHNRHIGEDQLHHLATYLWDFPSDQDVQQAAEVQHWCQLLTDQIDCQASYEGVPLQTPGVTRIHWGAGLQVDVMPRRTETTTTDNCPCQDPFSSQPVQMNLQPVWTLFADLDAHIFLPKFDIDINALGHPGSQHWAQLPWWDFTEETIGIYIYYDGSFTKDPDKHLSGIAAAAFAFTPSGWKFAGSIAGEAGDFAKSSYTAEVWAAICATKLGHDLVKLNSMYQAQLPTLSVAYVAKTVGKQADGHWAVRSHVAEGKALRALTKWVESRFAITIHGWHVPAHEGEPGNELVDSLSKNAAKGDGSHDITAFHALIQAAGKTGDIEWLWMLHGHNEFWFGPSGDLLLPSQPTTTPTAKVFPQSLTEPPMAISDLRLTHEVKLKICSYNVLSLNETVHNMQDDIPANYGPARQESLMRQLHDLQITIFGLQETRQRHCAQTHDPRYWLFRGPATDRGHLGVMVGFSRTIELVEGIYFQEKDFALIDHSPRHLVIRVKNAVCHFICIVGHAPHKGATNDEIQDFWTMLTDSVPKRYESWPRLLLADANAHLGQEVCINVGDHQAEPMDEKDDYFLQFLCNEDLWIPSTFQDCQVGAGHTWTHSGGKTHRLDYIGLPLNWRSCPVECWVEDQIDASVASLDHQAVAVSATIPGVGAAQMTSPVYKLQVPDDQSLPIMSQLPVRSLWRLDAHTHAAQLQQHLCGHLQPARKKKENRPMKTTMSEATWQLVCQKKRCRHVLAQLNQEQRALQLKLFFKAWKHSEDTDTNQQFTKAMNDMLRQMDVPIAQTYAEFKRLGRQVTMALRKDDALFYRNMIAEVGEFVSPGQAKQLWKIVQRSLPKNKEKRKHAKPLALEKLEDQWIPHLEQMEVGCMTSTVELVSHQMGCPCSPPSTSVDRSFMPTLFEVEDTIRAATRGKATGLDPLPSGFYKHHATSLARYYYALFLKLFTWSVEPLSWKGGVLHLIPKKPQCSRAEHYRGILLMQTMAKRFHGLLRQRVMRILHDKRPSGQIGGFKGMQVGFGSQYLRMFNKVAKAKHLSTAVVFIDLKTAFHRLIREAIVGQSSQDDFERVLSTLQAEGLPIEVLRQLAETHGYLGELGAPEALRALLQDVHSGTWCTIDGQNLVHTHRGTRPGSPIADIMFHCAMTRMTIRLDKWLLGQDEVQQALRHMEVEAPSVVWADDVAVPLAVMHGDQLLPLLERLMTQIYVGFQEMGFLLNFDPGKTSAVVEFRGAGTTKLRTELLLCAQPGLEITFPDGLTHKLHFLPRYKHLGTMFTGDGEMDLELRQRIGQAKAAFQQIAKPVLANRSLPWEMRVRLLRVLILTKLQFGMGAWPTLTPRQYGRLQSTITKMLLRMMRRPPDAEHLTTGQILRLAELPGIRAQHAVERLAYAQKFYAHAPDFVQILTHVEFANTTQSWLHGLKADVEWMNAVLPNPTSGDWAEDFTTAIDYWQHGGDGWKGLIRRTVKKHLLQEHMMLDVHNLHTEIFKIVLGAEAEITPSPLSLRMAEMTHACHCGKCFDSLRGLLAHQRRAHQQFAPERPFLSGATCQWCLKYCWSTQRLQQHLAYIPRGGGPNPCFAALQARQSDLSYERVGMPAEVQGHGRRDALQLHGPQGHLPLRADVQRDQWQRECDNLRDLLGDFATPEDEETRGQWLVDRLELTTQCWCHRHARIDANHFDLVSDLENLWLKLLCQVDAQYQDWGSAMFVEWGQDHLPDIIARLEDGELEGIVGDAFADLANDLPYYQYKDRLMTLLMRMDLLDHADQAPPVAHRAIRWDLRLRLAAVDVCRKSLDFIPMRIGRKSWGSVKWLSCHALWWHLCIGRLRDALQPSWCASSPAGVALTTSMIGYRSCRTQGAMTSRSLAWTPPSLHTRAICTQQQRAGNDYCPCIRLVWWLLLWQEHPVRPSAKHATCYRPRISKPNGRDRYAACCACLGWRGSPTRSCISYTWGAHFSSRACSSWPTTWHMAASSCRNTRGCHEMRRGLQRGEALSCGCSANTLTWICFKSVSGSGAPRRSNQQVSWFGKCLLSSTTCGAAPSRRRPFPRKALLA